MKRNTIIFTLLIILMGIIIIYSFRGGESREEYIARIAKIRAEKDIYFKYNQESPFVKQAEKFEGLKYYQPDPDYKIQAKIEMLDQNEIVTLSTNDNQQKAYNKFGMAIFELEGKSHQLLILEMLAPYKGKLFLAFADKTSTEETYGAGRYLDVEYKGGNTIELDFNLAYNPYCAYVDGFSCPFPPPGNVIEASIKAGEKIYEKTSRN